MKTSELSVSLGVITIGEVYTHNSDRHFLSALMAGRNRRFVAIDFRPPKSHELYVTNHGYIPPISLSAADHASNIPRVIVAHRLAPKPPFDKPFKIDWSK